MASESAPAPIPVAPHARLHRGLSLLKVERKEEVVPTSSSSSSSSSSSGEGSSDEVELHLRRKTKITCTLGPATSTVEKISELLRAGMNVARFNFSHGSHESHQEMLETVRRAVAATGIVCALMLDTKGPEIRTGLLRGGVPVRLVAEQSYELFTELPAPGYVGDEKGVAIDYANLGAVVGPGSIIKIDDGLIVCVVTALGPKSVTCKITNSAELGQRKGVNLPDAKVDLPEVTEKDIADFKFAVKNNMDFIAASFCRKASGVREIRAHLGEAGKHIKIISKIENQEGLDNFDEILHEADGIMVARGDLGVEIPIQKVTTAQKMMIRKCNIAGKPVITATQMLESMISNPRPTRAEATDVANAVIDGTDCVMLSGETAKGDYPFEAVRTMARICVVAETAIDYQNAFTDMMTATKKPVSRAEALTSSAVKIVQDLSVGAIVALTESGSTARFIAKYKPSVPIVALTTLEHTARHLLLSRAVYPVVVPSGQNSYQLRQLGTAFAKKSHWVRTGADLVVVSGTPGESGSTNSVRIITVS